MDKASVTRPAPPSTRSVLAGAHLCDQVASLLLIESKLTRQVFLGEPVEEVLAMVKWTLKHESEQTASRHSTPKGSCPPGQRSEAGATGGRRTAE